MGCGGARRVTRPRGATCWLRRALRPRSAELRNNPHLPPHPPPTPPPAVTTLSAVDLCRGVRCGAPAWLAVLCRCFGTNASYIYHNKRCPFFFKITNVDLCFFRGNKISLSFSSSLEIFFFKLIYNSFLHDMTKTPQF